MTLTLLFTYSLTLVMILVVATATTDGSGLQTNITVVLGHDATFKCNVQRDRSDVRNLYIQRVIKDNQEIFINGFHESRPLTVRPEYQNRTRVDQVNLSLHMSNVSVSDEGLYRCVVFFFLEREMPEIYLKVIGEYSVPTLEKECSEGQAGDGAAGKSCQLSCSSAGGYPQSAVSWTELNHSRISVIHNNSVEDPSSKTWTLNQTIVYSCERPINVSCVVGTAVSPSITICETESFPFMVIVAIVVLLVFVLLSILVLVAMKHCWRRQNNQQILQESHDPAAVALTDCRSQLKCV